MSYTDDVRGDRSKVNNAVIGSGYHSKLDYWCVCIPPTRLIIEGNGLVCPSCGTRWQLPEKESDT